MDSAFLGPGNVQRINWLQQILPEDALAIKALIDSTVEDGGMLGYTTALTPEQCTQMCTDLQDALYKRHAHALLGFHAQDPACFAVLRRSTMPNCMHIAHLEKGVIHPRLRGRGLLSHIMRAIKVRAQQLGVELFTLDVREHSRSHLLWGKLGFQTFGILEDYARTNGVKHRGHYMAQTMDSFARRF